MFIKVTILATIIVFSDFQETIGVTRRRRFYCTVHSAEYIACKLHLQACGELSINLKTKAII